MLPKFMFITILMVTSRFKLSHQQCSSLIPEDERVDCHPELGSNQPDCELRGCTWCEAELTGTPWCFYDNVYTIPASERIDCYPEGGVTESTCHARGCIFETDYNTEASWCYFPLENGYRMVGSPVGTTMGYRVTLQKINTYTMFGGDIVDLILDVEFQTDDRVRVKIYDPNNARYEVPLTIASPSVMAANPNYDIIFDAGPAFSFKIIRVSTGTVLFDTSLGGFVFADQFIQISTKLPSFNLYGFGEHEHPAFKHDMFWEKYPMFARDQPPQPYANMYGVHPYYTVLENDFNAHGVLILNSNAQEFDLQPAPSITYRTIGGILDIYVFLGPTPENVVQQYTEAIGRTFMPPYWSLGFQLSRYGYDHIDVLRDTVDRMRLYDIPHDVQFGDIDYMDRYMDFTYDTVNYAGLPEYVDELKTEGTNYIIILDPCIMTTEPAGTYPAYDKGSDFDIWVKEVDGVTDVLGKVWPPDEVSFPDYTHPNAEQWWVDQCYDFYNVIKYDGLWIDMNEVANFYNGDRDGCDYNSLDNPPYKTKAWGQTLSDKTICMEHKQYAGNHYDLHSLYGLTESPPSQSAARIVTKKRSIVITRSTFPGVGQYAGHWLGDNYSNWPNMHKSIIGMLEFNIFGIPYIGADICGFIGDTNYELCLRWQQIGAFYPFSRNHNGYGYIEQDPGVFGEDFATIAKAALHVRYNLMPFLYTLFHESHLNGSTVVRPLMHEFVTDLTAHDIDRQFLWGPALLITPVLLQGMTEVSGYFPDAKWYDYYTGNDIGVRSQIVVLSAPLDHINVHVRGGYVLPTQEPGNSTLFTRTKPMGLIAALDDNASASGNLFWDDGDTLDTYENGLYFEEHFSATANELSGNIVTDGYTGVDSLVWGNIRVFGLSTLVTEVKINDVSHLDFTYDQTTQVLNIENAGAPLNINLMVTWL
ncbi:sucrase-isomaltase, intestinal-like [Saccoglossus kowalevskii]